jgi:CubicO group peptidase (beta-lactamase class C family)
LKKLRSIILVLITTATLIGCQSTPKAHINVEGELDKLSNVEGNIYINEKEAYEKIVNMLLYKAQKTDLRGSVIVATDDEVIFASGSRLLDIDGNEVSPYTIYEIGSVTKSITAVCIMKLMEEGKLSMEDTLGEIFSEYRSCQNFENNSKVTISDLLHMRSGIPDYMEKSEWFYGMDLLNELDIQKYDDLMKRTNDDMFLEGLFTCELLREPDKVFEYSNTNYRILALIIERVTGKSYKEYVNEVVFKPCGMSRSSAMADDDLTAAMNPDAWDDWYRDYFGDSLSFYPEFVKGAGDIHSNTVDLLKYHRALFGGYLLSEESMKELLTPVDSYACGWFIKEDLIYHGGDTPGFSTRNYVIERNGKRLYIIMLANSGENCGDVLLQSLEKIYTP